MKELSVTSTEQNPSTIQTSLRPDFHQWFPVFTPEEMRERLSTMPFEVATLLSVRNIRTALKIGSPLPYLRYLRQSPEAKQEALAQVLRSRGIVDEIAAVVADGRHHYARQHAQATAFMDRSLPVAGDTYLTSPGLVALMLTMSQGLKESPVVCEIGIGTGFHALCLARLTPGSFMLGVERSRIATSICKANIARTDFGGRFSLIHEAETDWAIACSQFIYSTAALTLVQLARLTRYGREGSTWLVPRQ